MLTLSFKKFYIELLFHRNWKRIIKVISEVIYYRDDDLRVARQARFIWLEKWAGFDNILKKSSNQSFFNLNTSNLDIFNLTSNSNSFDLMTFDPTIFNDVDETQLTRILLTLIEIEISKKLFQKQHICFEMLSFLST